MLQRGDFGPPFFCPGAGVVVRSFTQLLRNVTKCLFFSPFAGRRRGPAARDRLRQNIFWDRTFFPFPIHTASRLIILAYHFARLEMEETRAAFPVLADSFFFH